MAINDKLLVDNIIEDRIQNGIPSSNIGEVFEYLTMEQVLKEYDLSKEELLSCSVDGKDDGGIDSFFIFVNDMLLLDTKSFPWPRKNCDLTVYVITCKHKDSFQQAVLNNEFSTISELFDFSKSNDQLIGSYNGMLLTKRHLLMEAYRKTAATTLSFKIRYIYACRGDENEIPRNVKQKSLQIVDSTKHMFSGCEVNYDFLGVSSILELFRKKKDYDLNLPYVDQLSQGMGNFVVLTNIYDLYKFITDEKGQLRKYLFDSNVRDYMGLNPVNSDIYDSLRSKNNIDFWWLNNGVTIIADSAINLGNELKMSNVQIVNGLQTSHTIYEYFKGGYADESRRSVMIKIISQPQGDVRDAIIKSTNNQTAIQTKSLFATDKIQRDIEEVMKHSGLFYERRVNCYANAGIESTLIVDIMYLAAAYVGLLLKVPEKAANFKQKWLKDETKYNIIFNENVPLEIWPTLAKIGKKIDQVGLNVALDGKFGMSEKRLKRSRYVVALICVGRMLGSLNFNAKDLCCFETDALSVSMMTEVWDFVAEKYDKTKMLKRGYSNYILREASLKWEINDIESIVERTNPFIERSYISHRKAYKKVSDEEIISHIPGQPWESGMNHKVAKELGIKVSSVNRVIKKLIKEGVFFHQRNGVLCARYSETISGNNEKEGFSK